MRFRLVVLLSILSAPALARPGTSASTALTLGPQVVDGCWGGEASLVLFETDGHVTGGAGLVVGATSRGGYAEAEAILILTVHDDEAAKLGHEYPGLFFTAGGGPAVRWDGQRGWQATLGGALVFLPVFFFARLERYAGASTIVGGAMIKLPVWIGP